MDIRYFGTDYGVVAAWKDDAGQWQTTTMTGPEAGQALAKLKDARDKGILPDLLLYPDDPPNADILSRLE